MTERFPAHAWVAGCVAGFLACALLVVNNLRDIPTDRAAGKRTLAVRLGDRRARWLDAACVAAARAGSIIVIAVVWRAWTAIALAGLVAAVPPILAPVRGGAKGRGDPGAGRHGRTQLVVGLLVALGLAWAARSPSPGDVPQPALQNSDHAIRLLQMGGVPGLGDRFELTR